MDLVVKKDIIHINELLFENTSEQSIDGDITLPDYCPDVKKILKCIVTPRVISAQYVGDRVSVEGNALIQIIYVDEENKIYCYDKSFPFSKNIEIGKSIENSVLHVKIKTAYANTRAVSQRKIDIHVSVALTVSICGKKDEEIISDAENCGIQLLKNCKGISDFIGETVKSFSIEEVMETGKNKSPIKQIVRRNVNAYCDEIKVINNKILIKGEMCLNILYCKDGAEAEFETYENSMPISQIVELEGVNENSKCSVRLCVCNCDIIPKADSSGEMKLLDVRANINATVKAENVVDCCYPSDCYSTQYSMKCEKKLIAFENIDENADYTIMVKKKESFSNISVGEIINVWCDDVTTSYSKEGNNLKITGSFNACILGKDKDMQPFYSERVINFEKIKEYDDPSNFSCSSDASVSAVSYVLTADNEIDLRIEVKLFTEITERQTKEILTDISCDESDLKQKKYAALTIYFSDEGEVIWNIARKYNTTVDAIKLENDIKDNIVSEKSMLLIPCV